MIACNDGKRREFKVAAGPFQLGTIQRLVLAHPLIELILYKCSHSVWDVPQFTVQYIIVPSPRDLKWSVPFDR